MVAERKSSQKTASSGRAAVDASSSSGSGRLSIVVIVILVLAVLSFILTFFFVSFSSSSSGTSSSVSFSTSSSGTARVGHVQVNGPIVLDDGDSFFVSGMASSADLLPLLKRVAGDTSLDAVLIEINSPGGSPVASQEIGDAIKAIDVPTVALIREVGASGGYWIASAADHIVANEMSITGSIGVIGSQLNFAGFLERYNVTYDQLIAGDNKDLGTPFNELNEDGRAILQERLDLLHDVFIREVADNRGMSVEDVEPLATGLWYLGSQARDNGLVDELGSFDEVDAWIMSQTNTSDVQLISFRKEPSFFEALAGASAQGFFHVGQGIGDSLAGSQKEQLYAGYDVQFR